MKLQQFIEALENIAKNVDNPKAIDVRMADYIPVVNPVLKDNTVFITDIEL